MEQEKYPFIESELEKLKKNDRAKPDPGLFAKIEAEINRPDTATIPMQQLRLAAAAALLILLLNTFALVGLSQRDATSPNSDQRVGSSFGEQLISDYNIYE